MTPIFATLGGWLLLGHNFDRRFLIGMILTIGGAISIGIQDLQIATEQLIGDALALFSGREQRREIRDLLEENPSLKPYLLEALHKAYQAGLDLAVRETPLTDRDFPAECPYAIEQVLDATFFPGQPVESGQNWVVES
jgi:hypothetical protein